jgi:hypothetical protein
VSDLPTRPLTAEEVLEELRRPVTRTLLFRGFGPLVVAIALLVAMVILLPSVAPEHIIQRPVAGAGATP